MANKYYSPATADGQVLWRSEFDLIESGFNTVESDWNSINSRVTALEASMSGYGTQIATNTTNIASLNTSLNAHTANADAHTQYVKVTVYNGHVSANLHLPGGGEVGQSLIKNSTSDYDASWGVPASVIQQWGASITGTGAAETDLNAMDFTGHPEADATITTALLISSDDLVYFAHNGTTYVWVGPKDTTVGLGGAHTAVAADLSSVGTGDHSLLTNLTASDAHPQTSIGGRGADATLEADQISQDGRLTTLETFDIDHTTPATVPDPHAQYLATANAQSVFAFSAYGSMWMASPTAFADISAAYQTITTFDSSTATPSGVTLDTATDTFTVTNEGEYCVSITISLSHNSDVLARSTTVRLYNVTDAAVGRSMTLHTPPNVTGTTCSVTLSIPFDSAIITDTYRLEIGGNSSYTSVNIEVLNLAIWNVGTYVGTIPGE
jgi:hypothetical protein